MTRYDLSWPDEEMIVMGTFLCTLWLRRDPPNTFEQHTKKVAQAKGRMRPQTCARLRVFPFGATS